MYQIEFTIDTVTELTTNVIAESMYTQYDAGENEYLLLDMLFNYRKDKKVIDQYTSIQGRLVTCKTTKGWQICCQWKDGSISGEVVQVKGISSGANC